MHFLLLKGMSMQINLQMMNMLAYLSDMSEQKMQGKNKNILNNIQEELTDLKADRTLKLKLEIPLGIFRFSVRSEYPAISEIAVHMLLQFSTTYLCELGFSTFTEIKTSKRESQIHL